MIVSEYTLYEQDKALTIKVCNGNVSVILEDNIGPDTKGMSVEFDEENIKNFVGRLYMGM